MLVIYWIVFILVLTAIPVKETRIVNRYHFDKIVHFSLFFILGIFSRQVMKLGHFLVLATATAICSEVQQFFVPGRQVELLDLLANLVGVGFSLVFFYHIFATKENLKS